MIATPYFRITRALAVGLLFAFTHGSPASAQEATYDLAADDTWQLADAPDPESPEGRLAVARQTLAREEYRRARELADAWIEEFEDHQLLPLAYLTRGDALFGQREYYDALFDYEAIARLYPGSDVFVAALERELEIARLFAAGTKRKLWGLRIIDATDEAEELLIRIQERMPGSNLAEQAGMELGDFYFQRGEMTLAVDAYDLFIENYPDSDRLTKARRRLIAAHLASFKGPKFDPTGLLDAGERLRQMQVLEPAAAQEMGADALLQGIDEKLARKMLVTAEWYLQTGDWISAEFTLRRLLVRYDDTATAADAARLAPRVLDHVSGNLLEQVRPFYEEKIAAILGSAPPAASNADEAEGTQE